MKRSILLIGFLSQVIGLASMASASSLSNEKCWSAKPILKSTEESKKLKEEQELCAMDFYNEQYSICPKLNSTFPGVLVIKRPENMSDGQFRSQHCARLDSAKASKIAKVEAKFKQSTSCSHASSPVAYYRIAEFLGGIKVPTAVFRTMDKQKHLEITKTANGLLSGRKDLIAQTWRHFLTLHANPAQYPGIFQNGEVFGALSENVTGEFKFTAISGVGNYETRYERFMQQPAFLAVSSGDTVTKLAGGSDFKKLAQKVTTMRDVSNMVLIDYMLNQADRIGNIHFKYKLYKLENGKIVETKSETELDEKTRRDTIPASEQQRISEGEILIRETVLKDNDCGVSKSNKMRSHKILERVRHMSAKTYRQTLKLAEFIKTEEGTNYLRNELRIPTNMINGDDEVSGIKSNIIQAARVIKANCESGMLKLDLNLEKLLADPNYSDSCNVDI